MGPTGYYVMHRGWLDHPSLSGEPYDKRSAWCWLIENAVYKPATVGVGGVRVHLERGQVAVSIRFLAAKWQWGTKRVQRFLRDHTFDQMLTTAATTGLTVITISNYDRFQIGGEKATTPSTTGSTTPTTTKKKETNNLLKEGSRAPGLFPDSKAPTTEQELTPQAIVFGQCREFLINYGGLKDRNARALLGKWIRETSAATVIEVVSEAQARSSPDPVGFIVKGLAARRTQPAPKQGYIP